jgi:hypothetical protein
MSHGAVVHQLQKLTNADHINVLTSAGEKESEFSAFHIPPSHLQ